MITKAYDLGLKSLFHYRPYTCDEDLIRSILIDRKEYGLFIRCKPKVIFDIGANIGCTSVLLANAYPEAIIYAFEPVPSNYDLLLKNVEAYPNIKPFKIAIGDKTEMRTLKFSDDEYNLGGFSFHDKGVNPEKHLEVQVIDIRDFIKNTITGNIQIDLLKVDTEGSEYEILKALHSIKQLPPFIMGEGHGVNDWKMFEILEETHQLQLMKPMGARVYPFYAERVDTCQS